MGCEGDETSKRSKPTNHPSMQYSCPTLPPELITSILERLPVKPLLRFRSVSISWLASVSSPEFINTPLCLSANYNDNPHHRLLLWSAFPVPKFMDCSLALYFMGLLTSLDYTFPKHEDHRIVGNPVNGLICLSNGTDVVLWNPSIRKSKKLPRSLAVSSKGGYRIYSFGYDELHDDYKVVGFFCKAQPDDCFPCDVKVEIYNSKSDSWRTFDDFQWGLFVASPKLLNGKLNWFTNGSFHDYNCRDIVSIDLTDEKWGKVEQPCYGEGVFPFKLDVLGSNLSMLCISERTRTASEITRADVWIMKEYGVKEFWTKMPEFLTIQN